MLFNVQQAEQMSARVEGVEYDVVIDAYLAEFRAEASGTQQLSELEEKVVRLLPQPTEVLPVLPLEESSRLLNLQCHLASWPATPCCLALGHETTPMPCGPRFRQSLCRSGSYVSSVESASSSIT